MKLSSIKFFSGENILLSRHVGEEFNEITSFSQISKNDTVVFSFNNDLESKVEKIIQISNETGCRKFILDGSFEGPALKTIDGKPSRVARLLGGLSEYGICFLYVTQNELAPDQFSSLKICERSRVIVFNSIECSFRNQMKFISDRDKRDKYLKEIEFFSCSDAKTKILCLNNISKPHRLALCAFLFKNKLFTVDNRISFKGVGLARDVENNAKELAPYLENEIDEFIFYLNKNGGGITLFGESGGFNPRSESSLNRTNYSMSGISIVTESEFTNGSVLRITEKTYKAIAGGHDFLLLSNPGSLEYLERLGFNFDKTVFKNNYDKIEDPVERLKSIILEVESYITLSELEKLDLLKRSSDFRLNNLVNFGESFSNYCDERIVSLKMALEWFMGV